MAMTTTTTEEEEDDSLLRNGKSLSLQISPPHKSNKAKIVVLVTCLLTTIAILQADSDWLQAFKRHGTVGRDDKDGPGVVSGSGKDDALEAEIKKKYGFVNASKQDAVDSAVGYVIEQQKALEAAEAAEAEAEDSNNNNNSNNDECTNTNNEYSKYLCMQRLAASAGAPPCTISMVSLKTESLILYAGPSDPPQYSDSCGLLRSRYHAAPLCEAEEEEASPLVWKYRMVHRPAFEGKCVAPDVSPEGIKKAYESKYINRNRNRPVNIMFMGLSFMGQPFMSYVCLNEESISFREGSGGWLLGRDTKGDPDGFVPLEKVLKDGGKCTGYEQEHIADWYEPGLGTMPIPHQNVYKCETDAAYVHFGTPSEETMRLCYKYTFNLQQNVHVGDNFGCNRKAGFGFGFDIREADAIFALHSVEEVSERVSERANDRK